LPRTQKAKQEVSEPVDYEPLELRPPRRRRWWGPFVVVLAIPVAWYLLVFAIIGVLILLGHRDWLDHLGH